MKVTIYSNKTLEALVAHYPIENSQRIINLFLGDELNIQLAIEIYKTVYPELEIIDERNPDYEWTIVGTQLKDPSRTMNLIQS